MWEVGVPISRLLPIAAHGQLPIEGLTWLTGQMAGSKLESRFLLLWRVAQGPPLDREVKFHASRRWRADFAHMESRTLIEIEGGIFIPGGGRHSRGAGYAKDAEKYLEAVLAGWTVIRLTEKQLDLDFIERIVSLVSARTIHPD
jgi:very-short-patch-repair endonuclease